MPSAATLKLQADPHLRLYSTVAWKRTRETVKARDGHQCVITEQGKRCPETTRLHVHHTRKVRHLWQQHAVWRDFVRAACDPSILITVCQRHNNQLDAAMSKGGRVAHARTQLYASRMSISLSVAKMSGVGRSSRDW